MGKCIWLSKGAMLDHALQPRNIIRKWRKHFLIEDAGSASGHVDRFSDFLVRDAQDERKFFRADKLLEDVMEEKLKAEPEEATCRLFQRFEKEKGLSDDKVKEYTIVRNQADAYSQEEITEIFRYLRPETAQGIFLNYKSDTQFCLEQNAGRLPFGVAQAEIEWFVKPNAKDMKKFKAVKSLELQLFSSEQQLAGGSPKKVAIGDGGHTGEVDHCGMVNNETLGYFIARQGPKPTYLFLVSLGIKSEHCQHLPTEMAHYATDCPALSLIEVRCVGIADRACFDLSAHAKAAKVDLAFRETLEKPIEMEVLRGHWPLTIHRALPQCRFSTHGPVILSFPFLLLPAHRHPGIMGCASSASVMHDDLEDASLTRVVFTDAAGQEFVEHSAPFKAGFGQPCSQTELQTGGPSTLQFHANQQQLARNIGKGFESGTDPTGLNEFLATVEQNPRMLEKRLRQAKLLKVAKEISEQSVSDVSTDVSNFASFMSQKWPSPKS
ncbi:Glycine--tRNA ligase [Symbiodinium microadriaticum]|uniref:Glycine--tRNA ligase n=1 Tax=Symbiodinium microadriaticum TaxID=2951 RepID=A0A1Q9EMV5_SYMMI|nr:Glycine--tRNA ligase [Symbiodinium microadriaticum]